jgi:hypothetical protein
MNNECGLLTMRLEDVFHFQDGRTVFLGSIDGTDRRIPQCLVEIWVDGKQRSAPFMIEGEMLAGGRGGPGSNMSRAVSTGELKCLDREVLSRGVWELRPSRSDSKAIKELNSRDSPGNGAFIQDSERRENMHRHLIGLKDPPVEYVPDPMTQGPVLPEGWDGDAWVDPNPRRPGYFLRAWNKSTGRVADAQDSTYESARRALLAEVSEGTRKVEVRETSAVGTT